MIITFLGHSSLSNCNNLFENIQKTITENITHNDTTLFYCGGYGDFDNLCAQVCRSIKKNFPKCEIIFVTPYITKSQQENLKYLINNKQYDSIIYPPLEKIPPKFAINKRNE